MAESDTPIIDSVIPRYPNYRTIDRARELERMLNDAKTLLKAFTGVPGESPVRTERAAHDWLARLEKMREGK